MIVRYDVILDVRKHFVRHFIMLGKGLDYVCEKTLKTDTKNLLFGVSVEFDTPASLGAI
jgi:hypothetical protein